MPLSTPHHGQMSNSMYTAPNYLPLYLNSGVPPGAPPSLMVFNPVALGFEQERETVQIYIPTSMVGAIIGKSGAAIKEMISTSGASIKVDTPAHTSEAKRNGATQDELGMSKNPCEPVDLTNDGSPSSEPSQASPRTSRYLSAANDPLTTRRVTIVGYPASQYSAQYMIYRKIAVESGKGDISLMVELSIPSQLVGKIIGKGGATVKSLQKQTRTTIRLPEDKANQPQGGANGVISNSESCVQITGDFEGSQAAQRHIKSLIRESLYSKTKPQHFRNSQSSNSNHNSGGNNSSGNLQAGHNGNPIARTMPLSTPHHHGQMPNSMYTTPNYMPLYSNSSIPTGAPGLMMFNSMAPSFEQKRETVYIYIPSTMVGAIIGKSGAAIKEMISTSGASIKVATPPHQSETHRNDHTQEEPAKVVDTEQPIDLTNADQLPASSDKNFNDEPSQQQQQAPSSTNPKVSRYQNASNDPLTTRRVTIVGYPASQYSAQYMIYRKIAVESGKGDISLMVELSIPSQLVGKIIGKGGATVKSLQKQTRTTIRVPEDKANQSQANIVDGSNSESFVQITGDFEGSQAAQRRIKSMIRESYLHTRPLKSQHYRNNNNSNESNAEKNTVQNSNHQRGDNGRNAVPASSDDRFASTRSNEKAATTDESTLESSQDMSQRESPSLSCNQDCHSTKQEDQKSHPISQSVLSSSTVTADDESGKIRVENESISNNNTMINNLNSTKQPVAVSQQQQQQQPDVKLQPESLRNSDCGDVKGYHIENGESQKATS